MPAGPSSLLLDVAAKPTDVTTVVQSVVQTVRTWIGAGPVFVATADPTTGAFASTFAVDIPDDAASAFFDIEMSGRDPLTFRSLTAAGPSVGSLFASTQDAPASSARWREVIEPLGWGDEMRAAVRADGAVWGYLCLHREASDRPFRPADMARLTALLPAIARALRRSFAAAQSDGVEPGNGVLIVDERERVVGMTGAAAAWVEQLGPIRPGGLPLPLAAVARAVLDGSHHATATVSTRTGAMALAEAAPLGNSVAARVAIVVGPAPVAHRLARLSAAVDLTEREREVIGHVLDGLSTRAIAERLSISPSTVQAHLTSVFGKTGLRSRRDLIARLLR